MVLFVVGAVGGLGLTVLVAGSAAGFFAYSYVKKVETEAREGWTLVPVVVASKDLAPRTMVEFEMISERRVPEVMRARRSSWSRSMISR